MLVILGALKQELSGLKSKVIIEKTIVENDCLIYLGKYREKDILMGQTGIGKERAENSAAYILERYPATALVSLGFSGALVDGLEAGDVVLYNKLLFGDYPLKPDSVMLPSFQSDITLISEAMKTEQMKNSKIFKVNGFTTSTPLLNPEIKAAINQTYDVQTVDMESYWIARIASNSGIPFIGIRAISDTIKDVLPPFDSFINSGKIQLNKTAQYFVTHPLQLFKLYHLYRNSCKAEKNLTIFIDTFIANYKSN